MIQQHRRHKMAQYTAPGTKVESPRRKNGKGKVPNSDLPDVEKLGTGTTTKSR